MTRLAVIVTTTLLVLVGFGILAGESEFWGRTLAVLASQEAAREWIESLGAWAPAAYLLASAAQVIVAPIPGGVLAAVGAAAFGPEAGLSLGLAGATVGSSIGFALTRRWGKPLALRLVGRGALDRYTGIVDARGGLWLFVILLIPVLPGDAACTLAGLSGIAFRRFLLVTTFGRLPGMALVTYLTSSLPEWPRWAGLALAAALLVVVAVGIRLRPRLESGLVETAAEAGGESSVSEPQSSTEPTRRRDPVGS